MRIDIWGDKSIIELINQNNMGLDAERAVTHAALTDKATETLLLAAEVASGGTTWEQLEFMRRPYGVEKTLRDILGESDEK
ncbi:MAG: hypothetical protein US89_C0007G0025 [Candidatus Peregrinibacteria bacterium GW2011_GWF2_38_29]|nr:MAG: hypothetical protein US89_C0007G0025 [Candidatus Peregrinibacteria bacterium GW2011_GWF2_38_29]HBB02842.1 hypothetical protein [Candidatus Peregrinibacteria bacterium]